MSPGHAAAVFILDLETVPLEDKCQLGQQLSGHILLHSCHRMSGLSDSRKGRHSGGQRLRIEHSIAIPGKYVCNLREEMIPPGERLRPISFQQSGDLIHDRPPRIGGRALKPGVSSHHMRRLSYSRPDGTGRRQRQSGSHGVLSLLMDSRMMLSGRALMAMAISSTPSWASLSLRLSNLCRAWLLSGRKKLSSWKLKIRTPCRS